MAKGDSEPIGTLDLIIEELGQSGKYNIKNYLTIIIPVLFAGMFGSAYVFIAGDVNYRCKVHECESLNSSDWLTWAIPEGSSRIEKCTRFGTPFIVDAGVPNATETQDSANICMADWFDNSTTLKCDDFVYGTERTIVKDFNLGCQEWKRTLVGSIHNAGFFVSLSLTGIFSDRFGRKNALVIASIMNGIAGTIRSFSTSYEMFLIFEFLETAFGGGLYTSAFILMMEMVSPKNRVLMNSLMSIVFSLGLVTMSGISWVFQDWRITLRIMYIPAIFFIIYLWILDESVRWLLSRGRQSEAIKIIKKAAKSNKVNLPEDLLFRLYNDPEEKELKEIGKPKSDKSYTEKPVEEQSKLRQVLNSPIIMKRVISCAFLWVTCTFTYYGLSINSVSLSGNKFLNFMFVCLIEVPSHLSAIFIVDRIGRRKTLITTFTLGGISCIALAFIPKEVPVLPLVLYLCGKFAITLSYNSVYLFISEVFPTSLRQSLLGFTSTLGRCGSLVAPQVPLMAYYMESLPSILFGLMGLASGALSFTMPETRNKKLPDTIEEAENINGKT